MIDSALVKTLITNDQSSLRLFSSCESICMAAVKDYAFIYAIQYINNPSIAVCLAAIERKGDSIYYIKNPTEEACLAAVAKNGIFIRYIKNPSEAVCLAAIKRNGIAIRYIDHPTDEALRLAAADTNVRWCLHAYWKHYDALQRLIYD